MTEIMTVLIFKWSHHTHAWRVGETRGMRDAIQMRCAAERCETNITESPPVRAHRAIMVTAQEIELNTIRSAEI